MLVIFSKYILSWLPCKYFQLSHEGSSISKYTYISHLSSFQLHATPYIGRDIYSLKDKT